MISTDDLVSPPKCVDQLIVGDARNMSDVADNSVALVVTSPPYFAGKAYEEALGHGHVPATYLDYLQQLRDVFAECVRVLEPGGRIAVNVANLGRRPYRSLSADVTAILQDDLRLAHRAVRFCGSSNAAPPGTARGAAFSDRATRCSVISASA